MAAPPLSGRTLPKHVSLEAGWKVEQGIRLQTPPFSDHGTTLTDITDYRAPQELGNAMHSAGVQAFEYHLARCLERGCDVTLFVPTAFIEKRLRNLTSWLCETTAGYVAFKLVHVPGSPKVFSWELFLVDGRLPYLVRAEGRTVASDPGSPSGGQ